MDGLTDAAKAYLRDKWPKTYNMISYVYDDRYVVYIGMFDRTYCFIFHTFTEIHCSIMNYLETKWHKICRRGVAAGTTKPEYPYIRAVFEISDDYVHVGKDVIHLFHARSLWRLENQLRHDIESLKIINAILPQPIAEEIGEYF
jgi:hypothetical protein